MAFEFNVKLIIMVCQLKEKNMSKCERYWPNEGETLTVDEIKIKSLKDFDTGFYGLRERNFEITDKKGNIKNITQLNFTKWPDHGVPEVETVLDTFIEMLNRVQEHLKSFKETSPVIVHCSAGVGRTGTFISLFNIIQDVNSQLIAGRTDIKIKFNIWNTVRKIKEQRRLSVENFYQYQFIYKFIGKLLRTLY